MSMRLKELRYKKEESSHEGFGVSVSVGGVEFASSEIIVFRSGSVTAMGMNPFEGALVSKEVRIEEKPQKPLR